MTTVERVSAVYEGSDGEATRALYAELTAKGPLGEIAVNLFRANKTSGRAKDYRGGNSKGRYKTQAYDTKAWSIENLCRLLEAHSAAHGIVWGWQEDAKREPSDPYRWVLYVDIPGVGQSSFHSSARGCGPAHPTGWNPSVPSRIVAIIFAAQVLDEVAAGDDGWMRAARARLKVGDLSRSKEKRARLREIRQPSELTQGALL